MQKIEFLFEPYQTVCGIDFNKYDSVTFVTLKKQDNISSRLNLVSLRCTPLILVADSGDEILGSFKKTVRNEIRRTYLLDNLSISTSSGEKLNAYKTYCAFEKEQNRKPINYLQFEKLHLTCAIISDRVISGILWYFTEGGIRVHSIFSNRAAVMHNKKEYMLTGFVSKRLVFELCLLAKKKDMHHVDLAYINKTDQTKQGVTAYKMSFNPVIVSEYKYRYCSRRMNILDTIVSHLRSAINCVRTHCGM